MWTEREREREREGERERERGRERTAPGGSWNHRMGSTMGKFKAEREEIQGLTRRRVLGLRKST